MASQLSKQRIDVKPEGSVRFLACPLDIDGVDEAAALGGAFGLFKATSGVACFAGAADGAAGLRCAGALGPSICMNISIPICKA